MSKRIKISHSTQHEAAEGNGEALTDMTAYFKDTDPPSGSAPTAEHHYSSANLWE